MATHPCEGHQEDNDEHQGVQQLIFGLGFWFGSLGSEQAFTLRVYTASTRT